MTNRLTLRIENSDLNLICKACKARGETLSSFCRRSIKIELARLGLLSDEEKQLLGVEI